MATIHHATRAKAEKIGIILGGNDAKNTVSALWPERGITIDATDAKTALAEIVELRTMALAAEAEGVHFGLDYNDTGTRVKVLLGGKSITERHDAPTAIKQVFDKLTIADFKDGVVSEDEASHEVLTGDDLHNLATGNAVAADGVGPDAEDTTTAEYARKRGAVDYENGVVAADCPYDNEAEDEDEQARAEAWYEGWDEAADGAEDEDEEEKSGSVVNDKYRALYAEAGHPDNCGDWLAILLEGIVTNDAGTNLPLFEEICEMNAVDLSKYNRTSLGWQGRLRMTGRNLLARKVFLENVLVLPEGLTPDGTGRVTPPAEWIATRPYKRPKAKAE